MSLTSDLYQDIILDHNRRPRNFGELAEANRKAEGYNPLCGDKVTVFLKLEGDVIKDIRFKGAGCAISTASASIMTETLKGKTAREAEKLFERFRRLVTGSSSENDENEIELGSLAVFRGVRDYPVRVKCATLAWHTLKASLEGKDQQVTTE
ncbi:MAG TPA: SUF system NifU family Fe-S cluster assembly protein [Acidobacteriota bacterium]|nr:SUF system NifU family Fe-S cluster assembly protein [Acidobacteriota bacterium]